MTLPYEIASSPKHVQDHYRKMIREGQSERFALMCSLQVAPGTKGTDRAFQQGRLDGNWLDGLPKRQATKMVSEARASGINISGKQYVSGLADKRGHCDPEAWVSDTNDVKRVAMKRNLTVQGVVTHQGTERPRKSVAINPRIERRLVAEEMKSKPGLSRSAARGIVREKYAPAWKRKA